jgi:hypothetical protein
MTAFATVALSKNPGARTSDRAKAAIFIWSLIGATFLFYGVTPLVYSVWWPFATPGSFYKTVFLIITAHVVFTWIVYFDRPAYKLIEKHKVRFFLAAPGLIVGYFLFFVAFSKSAEAILMMPIGWWSYWHYQKQHYGVYAFVKAYYGDRAA